MEVVPRFTLFTLHCWHYLYCFHCLYCWHCWHGLPCWHGLHRWRGLHCWHGFHCCRVGQGTVCQGGRQGCSRGLGGRQRANQISAISVLELCDVLALGAWISVLFLFVSTVMVRNPFGCFCIHTTQSCMYICTWCLYLVLVCVHFLVYQHSSDTMVHNPLGWFCIMATATRPTYPALF